MLAEKENERSDRTPSTAPIAPVLAIVFNLYGGFSLPVK